MKHCVVEIQRRYTPAMSMITEDSKFLLAALAPTVTGLAAIATALILGGRMESRMDKLESSLNRVEAALSTRIDRVEAALSTRIERMQADLIVFYRDLGKHDGRLDALERNK